MKEFIKNTLTYHWNLVILIVLIIIAISLVLFV